VLHTGRLLKYQTVLKKIAMRKRSSLFRIIISDHLYSKILDYAKNKLPWTNTLAYLAFPSMTKKKIIATKANHLKICGLNFSLL